MRRVLAVSAVVGAATAACFIKPPAPEGGPLRDDAGNLVTDAFAQKDAPFQNPDVALGACAVELFDTSPAGSADCGASGWGAFMAGSGGYANVDSGELRLSVFGSAGSYVACTSQPNPIDRVTFDVVTITTTGSGGERVFAGLTDGVQRWGIEFMYDSISNTTGYNLLCPLATISTPTTWNSQTERFFQIEKWGTNEVRISTSADNGSYVERMVCNNAAEVHAGLAQVQLRAGKSGSNAGGILARIEELEICR